MAYTQVRPTGRETFFAEDEIIVSKTDLTGKITYANDVFLRVAGYNEAEIIGAPHSIIRHPAMPRAVFKLLWDTLHAQREIFAFVVNLAKNGDHYWVFAHVTPTYDASGKVIGYHSNRRVPERSSIAVVEPLYRTLRTIEEKETDPRKGLTTSFSTLCQVLAEKKVEYDEFVFSI